MVWGRSCERSEAGRAGIAGAPWLGWFYKFLSLAYDFINSWVHAVMDHLLSLVIIPAPGSFVLPWLDAGCVSCNLAWTPTSGCPFFLDFPLSGPSITEDSALLGLIHVLSVPRSHIHFLLTAGSSFSCQGSPSSGVSGQDHNVPNALGLGTDTS